MTRAANVVGCLRAEHRTAMHAPPCTFAAISHIAASHPSLQRTRSPGCRVASGPAIGAQRRITGPVTRRSHKWAFATKWSLSAIGATRRVMSATVVTASSRAPTAPSGRRPQRNPDPASIGNHLTQTPFIISPRALPITPATLRARLPPCFLLQVRPMSRPPRPSPGPPHLGHPPPSIRRPPIQPLPPSSCRYAPLILHHSPPQFSHR
ncbi:hypothetical protein K439DRAFT_1638080 [Ramaria rubella]|nr:hypothetical protein K439DRAFT_1638080 [Ramaria rubella]